MKTSDGVGAAAAAAAAAVWEGVTDTAMSRYIRFIFSSNKSLNTTIKWSDSAPIPTLYIRSEAKGAGYLFVLEAGTL